MTRLQCKELLSAVQHFANGGNLWCYGETNKQWKNQGAFFVMDTHKIENIIEDKHFEARKHFALGGEIECRYKNTSNPWILDTHPMWKSVYEYRPKPVYEWQWYTYVTFNDTKHYHLTDDYYYAVPDKLHSWKKFEPSKRLVK